MRKLFQGTQYCSHYAVWVTHPHNCWYWLLLILCSLKMYSRLLKQLFQLTGWCQTVWCHLLLCPILTNTITDGTPGGNNGLVQALLARCSVSSASQTILSHKRRTISATGKTKVLIHKVCFAGWIWKAQAPTDQRLALRNMKKVSFGAYLNCRKNCVHRTLKDFKNMSRLEKPCNIAQKRRYREHEFGGFAEQIAIRSTRTDLQQFE